MSKTKGKMLVVQVRFFTSNLKKKAVWDSGAIYIPKQTKHGIENPKSPEMFNGMEEVGVKIKTALKRQSVDIVRYNSGRIEKKIS